MVPPVILIAVISILLPALSTGQKTTGPLFDPISTTAPNLPGGTIQSFISTGPFLRDFKPPFPTDAWWSGFTVKNQDATVAGPFPFQSRTRDEGFEFGMADYREFNDGVSIHLPTQYDWMVSLVGLPDDMSNRKATSWDTQTVCLQYIAGASTFDSCLVPGSPYMTLTFQNAAVSLTSQLGDISSFQWVDQGKKAKAFTNGGTYVIYVLDGKTIDLTLNGPTLTSPAGFSGTLRMAKLNETSQEAILDKHVGTYPTGVSMSYSVAGDVATINYEWSVVGNAADLLTLSYPHHRRALQNAQFVDFQYPTLKGAMKGVQGNKWTMQHALPTVTWFASRNPHPSCLTELIKTLEADVKDLNPVVPGDFYIWGGAVAVAAQLATIAEQVGREDLIPAVLAYLKTSMSYLLNKDMDITTAYDSNWGGVVNKEGYREDSTDAGLAGYNDHHFLYGYFLHVAAVIGKYDEAWLNQNLDFFMQMARDIGNPSPNDPHYTVSRHVDFFAGHSWASGLMNGAGSRAQESSTEAINGYYSVLLFATTIKNQAWIDYARILLALEITGAQTYWHLYPESNDPDTPYPEQDFRRLTTVGIVNDNQAGAWLYWGMQRVQIAAIQILPLTPVGEYTYDKAWIEQVLPYCKPELDDNTGEFGEVWKAVIYAAYATVNPQLAYEYSTLISSWGSGSSATKQLYFISTQASTGDICNAAWTTPEGIYNIQDVATGKYVVLKGTQLFATSDSIILAAKFTLSFRQGGSSIQAGINGEFVTADSNGVNPLNAIKDQAQGHETFRWAETSTTGVYEITAMVNKLKVSTSGDGSLVNNVQTNGQSSKYRLVKADGAEGTHPPATGTIKSVKSGNSVVSTAEDAVLKVTSAGGGTRFAFEQVGTSYAIKNLDTNKYVTGNPNGLDPLTATNDQASGWETYQIYSDQNAFVIVHLGSGNVAALSGANTIIPNSNTVDETTRWIIE